MAENEHPVTLLPGIQSLWTRPIQGVEISGWGPLLDDFNSTKLSNVIFLNGR